MADTVIALEPASFAGKEKRFKTQIVPFRAHHAWSSQVPREILRMYESHGEAYSALLNGKVIASAGVMIVAPGVGSAWGIITDEARERPFMLHRVVKKSLFGIMRRKHLRRVDVIVDPRNVPAVHWVQRLGFDWEGNMQKFYEDGHCAYLYGKTL